MDAVLTKVTTSISEFKKNPNELPNLLDKIPVAIPLPPDNEEETAGSTN